MDGREMVRGSWPPRSLSFFSGTLSRFSAVFSTSSVVVVSCKVPTASQTCLDVKQMVVVSAIAT